MTYKEILPYCLFFKGEELVPISFSQTDARSWLAEKKVFEEFPFLVSEEDPRTTLAAAVYSFLGKFFKTRITGRCQYNKLLPHPLPFQSYVFESGHF